MPSDVAYGYNLGVHIIGGILIVISAFLIMEGGLEQSIIQDYEKEIGRIWG